MRLLYLLLILFLFNNCSFSKDSKFLNENQKKRKRTQKKIKEIIDKSGNLMSLSFNEYKIFIQEYVKKSDYPDLNKWKNKLILP